MPLTVSNYLLGPLIAFAVVGVLAGILRWVLGRETPGPMPGPARDDYGLLCAAAVADSRETAESVRTLLARAGIRATVAGGADRRWRVLVFAHDLDQARRVVGRLQRPPG